MKNETKKDFDFRLQKVKRVLSDMKNTFARDGFKAGVKKYSKEIIIIIAVICLLIGIITGASVGIKHLITKDASDIESDDVVLSDMSYEPKVYEFTKNKAEGVTIQDTYCEIVIDTIGDVSENKDIQSICENGENIYVHYTFTVIADDNTEFAGNAPSVICVQPEGDDIVVDGVNKFKSADKWLDANAENIEPGRTYDGYAVFKVDESKETVYHFMNADGNLSILEVV